MILKLVHAFENLRALLDVYDATLNNLHQLQISLSFIQKIAHVIFLLCDSSHQPRDALFAEFVLLSHISMGWFVDEYLFDDTDPLF